MKVEEPGITFEMFNFQRENEHANNVVQHNQIKELSQFTELTFIIFIQNEKKLAITELTV